jgi:tetratricopeptide (TPR) repeat protein
LGDLALAANRGDEALEHYAAALRFAFDEDRVRSIEVKQFSINSVGRRAVVALLIGDDRQGTDLLESSAALGEWAANEPELGLADYLVGKNLYARERLEPALRSLDRALSRSLPLPSVRREALRLKVFAGCALNERSAARRALGQYFEAEGLSLARKAGMERFAARCRLLD